MPPLRDSEHAYRDHDGAEGRCRVRIFAATVASGRVPVVILSELTSNPGPSITTALESIAPTILTRYVPEQDGLEPAFVLVEHYPDRQPLGAAARYHDRSRGETFDRVTFAHYRTRPRWRGPHRGLMQSFGESAWRRISRAAVEALLGQELGEPACTCQLAPRP